jgi:hypothetical protein
MENTRVKMIYDHSTIGNRRPPRTVTDLQIVPSTIKLIGDRTFRAYTNLIHVELPVSLERIGKEAFFGCTSLSSVRLPSTVKLIGDRAFRDCIQLNNVELPVSLERIGKEAFFGCTSLSSVRLPSTVKQFGDGAFRDCTQLNIVEIQEGVEQIPDKAFFGCTSLSSVRLPSTIRSIGFAAFDKCAHLNNITLPEGLEEIKKLAFYRCTSLEIVRIPSTVKWINSNAFLDCTNMSAILFCEEINEFVSLASLQEWWNHGRSAMSLETYNYLVRHNIPRRTGEIGMMRWRSNIHVMIDRIPSIVSNAMIQQGHSFASELLTHHFQNIATVLSDYEHYQADVAPLLMLALWKWNITKFIADGYASDTVTYDEMRVESRYVSESMAPIIIQNVLDFLSIDEREVLFLMGML